jgi:hypothetical protein
MTRLALSLTVLLALLAAAAPAAAQVTRPAEVLRVESAMSELGRLKEASRAQVDSRAAAAERALRKCKTKGKGWERIRAVRDASQRNAYARGAKRLWGTLGEVVWDGARVEVFTPHYERFLGRFETPVSDPVIQAGIEAQRKRLAYEKAAWSFGTCRTFNKLLKKVKEFKIGGSHGVAGDYYAGRIHNIFAGYVASRQRAAARAHWKSSSQSALEAARDQLKALGGNEGLANYFVFAFRS